MACTEKELEYARRHRERHPEAVKAATKKWREKNKDKYKESLRQWKANNKDRVEASRQQFHLNNPDYKKNYQYEWTGRPKGRYLSLKTTARNRGHVLELSFEDWFNIIQKPCVYCGASVAEVRGYGLDRISSIEGYTKENSVPCCWRCNTMKSNLTYGRFIEHVHMIAINTGVLKEIS